MSRLVNRMVCHIHWLKLTIVFLFFIGSDTARLLISTDAAVMVSNLDGSGSEHLSDNNEIRLLTKESNGR